MSESELYKAIKNSEGIRRRLEAKVNPVYEAYNILFRVMYRTDGTKASESELTIAIEEALGYLGQALDTAPIEIQMFSADERREKYGLYEEAIKKMREYG